MHSMKMMIDNKILKIYKVQMASGMQLSGGPQDNPIPGLPTQHRNLETTVCELERGCRCHQLDM